MVEQPYAPSAAASVASAAGMSVRVCRTIAEIEEIRPEWASWSGHRDSDIDFFLEFIQSRPEVQRPHIIALSNGSQLDAILVGRLERTKFQSRIAYFRLPGIPVNVLSFSYGGFRGNTSPENCTRMVQSVLQSLRGGEADLAFFHQENMESPMYREILRLPDFRSRDHLIAPNAHHFMHLAAEPEQLLAGLSGKHRKHLRTEAKKIQTDFAGGVDLRQFVDEAQVDEALEHVESIAKTTYQRGLGVGFANNAEERRLFHFFARMGWLRIYVLFFNGTPCAYSVGSVSGNVYCCDYLGFDPKFGSYSPGTFLLTNMLEDFCRAGVTEVDFGPGEGLYKERFSNLTLQEASVSIFAPTAKGLLLNSVRTATVLADSSLKKALKRTNLLPKIKRMWRDRAAQGKKATG